MKNAPSAALEAPAAALGSRYESGGRPTAPHPEIHPDRLFNITEKTGVARINALLAICAKCMPQAKSRQSRSSSGLLWSAGTQFPLFHRPVSGTRYSDQAFIRKSSDRARRQLHPVLFRQFRQAFVETRLTNHNGGALKHLT
jgi:hypothetical protein